MNRLLPRIICAILIMVGLVQNSRDTSAIDSTPVANPERILKSGVDHCPAAILSSEPARYSMEELQKIMKVLKQAQHHVTRIDGARAVFEENLPRIVLYDSNTGFRAEMFLRDQQMALVWVYMPLVN